ncbi:hypothetical protein BV22DRAFT_1009482, partial [Leucogyrophana mollusca]
SYGSGLRKFHLFCDIFSVPESARLPASFAVLHSFALWAVADPGPDDPVLGKYLSAVRAWHIVQGWAPPPDDSQHDRITRSPRGLERLQGSRRRPLRPPITIPMLTALHATLDLTDPFDTCVWAVASCAFFGMMRFGEATVS